MLRQLSPNRSWTSFHHRLLNCKAAEYTRPKVNRFLYLNAQAEAAFVRFSFVIPRNAFEIPFRLPDRLWLVTQSSS
jgi:hypothetical protein